MKHEKYYCPKCKSKTLRIKAFSEDFSTILEAHCPCNVDGIFSQAIDRTYISERNDYKEEFNNFVKQFTGGE